MRWFICFMVTALLTSGCMDRIDIEDVSLALLVGVDLDDKNRLVFSASSPVFHQEAEVKEEEHVSYATTLSKSRDEDDKTFMALTLSRKVQVILINKRVMEHEGWFKLLEVFTRDPGHSITTRIVMVDGPVSEVIQFRPKNKPRLPHYLTKLIDTAAKRNICMKTTVQDLHSAQYEKAMTASITELYKDKEIMIKGTALLDEAGKYKLSIREDENRLLRLLQNKKGGEFYFTFRNEEEPKGEIFPDNAYTFIVNKSTLKTHTGYVDDRFQFDLNFKIRVTFLERLFPLDIKKDKKKFEAEIEQQLTERFERFIGKIQEAKIDPIGLGKVARAHRYSEWKEVQDRWGEALTKADVRVKVKVTIASMGATN